VDRPRPDPYVVQRVQGQNPLVLESTARRSMKCPKGAVAWDGLANGEVSRRLGNMHHGEVRGILLGC
jgi:hypothetical protein